MKAFELVAKPGAPRIQLHLLGSQHLEPYLEMLADPETRRLTATTQSFSRERIEQWLSSVASMQGRQDWAIVDDTGEFWGEIVLNEFNDPKNQMNIRMALRGGVYFSKGVGRQALALALEYAFDELALDKVTLEVLEENTRAIKVYQKLGFAAGRSFTEKGQRFMRMSIHKWQFFFALCGAGIAKYLDPNVWTFDYDNGKRRAGQCNYGLRRITISRYLLESHTIDYCLQTLAHEIAHALCGKNVGHGKVWLATAKSIGYRAEKFTGDKIAEARAPWVGTCLAGHSHYRYRKPTRELACGYCSRSYSREFLISWQKVS